MTLSEWFRPPRHVLTIFLAAAILSALALGWLTWLLLDQDRAVEAQRQQERLEQVADRATAVMRSGLADLELELNAEPPDAMEPPAGVVIVAVGPSGAVVLPSIPGPEDLEASDAVESPDAPFSDAERLEYARDLPAAEDAYSALAATEDPGIRAGALLRLARVLRKAEDPEAALAAYDALSEISGVRVGGLPPGLLARIGRAEVLATTGRTSRLVEEAAALVEDVRARRWRLTRAQHDLYLAEAARLLLPGGGPSDGSPMLVQTGKGPVLLIGSGSERTLRVAIAGRTYLDRLGGRAVSEADLAWALTNTEGDVVVGSPSPSRPAALRTAASAALPWSLEVHPLDAGSATASSTRRGLLVWVVALLALVWLTGAWFIVRAISRELAVERLQSDFVSAVSHEFRSPLSSMSQIAEMLVSGRLASDDLRRRSYEVLARETERLRQLVEGLLDFGRFEAGGASYHFESLELGAFLEDLVEDFRTRAAASEHSVEMGSPEGETWVKADRMALTRAIWNLLDNAVKYSPECPTVWVDMEREAERVLITVRDRGLGIPVSEQQTIFERFVRGDDSKSRRIRGTGVGLALVRRIIEAHGGEIRLASQPAEGSRFTLVLKTLSVSEAAGGAL